MFEKPNESSGNVIGYKAIGTLTGAGMGVVDYRSRGSRATLRDGLWTTLKWLVVGMILLSAIPPTAQAELDVPSTVFHEGNDVVGNVVIAAASCNQTDVQAAINSAVSGDTVLVPAGECTWTSGIGFSGKKITLIGAGIDSTVINRSSFGTVINMGQTASRVTGFTFNEGGILVDGDGWRIDHCKIYSASFSNGVLVRGTRSSAAHPTGLIDNCFFHNARVNVQGTAAMLHENDWQHILWTNSLDLGTNNNVVYVEDCNFELDVFGNAIDTNYGGAYVFRFNHLSHVYVELHSVQSNNRATRRWEIYGNTLDNPGGSIYFPYRIRAGTGVIFNETLVGTWTNYGIALDNVRSYAPMGDGGQCDGTSTWDGNEDATGYPCRDQIGRGPDNSQWNHILPAPAYTQPLIPVYGWGNRRQSNNALVPFQVINSGQDHIKPNRDYYEETLLFDGTTGVGVGVLADRPATCTTGVGYWATDQGSWNANGDDGVLYKCTSTDTWELYYIPHPYPHPLRGDSIPPANITDLSVSSCTVNSCDLTWTAPGDDGSEGTATTYDIRYSTSSITDANWGSAAEASGEPTPSIAGSNESFIITGLTPETPYYFAIKTSDEVPNTSGLSNVVSGTTPAGNVYYLDCANGDNHNDGSINHPWKTFNLPNINMVAGDTLYVRGGTDEASIAEKTCYLQDCGLANIHWKHHIYGPQSAQGVSPENDGDIINGTITYTNYPGETVRITSDADFPNRTMGVELKGKSRIRVTGLNFDLLYRFMTIDAGHYNEICHCTFDQVRYRNDDGATVNWRGSTIYHNATHNWVHDNVFSRYGAYTTSLDAGVLFELGIGTPSTDASDYNTIENNHMYHGGHHVFGVNTGLWDNITQPTYSTTLQPRSTISPTRYCRML